VKDRDPAEFDTSPPGPFARFVRASAVPRRRSRRRELLREIQIGKFAMKLARHAISGLGRRDGIIEHTDRNAPPPIPDGRLVLPG